MNSALLGLTPIFGTRQGLSPAFVVWLLTAFQLGSFVCQWPLGRLSDRIDRRLVIAGCVLAVAGLSAVAALSGGRQDWLLPVYFLLGGSTLTFYAVAVAHAADFAEPDQMVGVSSSLLLAWAAGSAVGPDDRRTVHRSARTIGACSSTASLSPPGSPRSCCGG